MFYAYMVIDGFFRGDQAKVTYWNDKMTPLLKERADGKVLPRYYYVPIEKVEAERVKPGSQKRIASDEEVFLWGQSVYIISQLLGESPLLFSLLFVTSLHIFNSLSSSCSGRNDYDWRFGSNSKTSSCC